MAYISLEHVVKRYKMGEVTITAVDDITFDIEKGEFVIIVGPSGAGKTTVLNILGGMDACDEGTILVDGKEQMQLTPADHLPALRHRLCFSVLQPHSEPHRPGKCGAGRPDLQGASSGPGGTEPCGTGGAAQ